MNNILTHSIADEKFFSIGAIINHDTLTFWYLLVHMCIPRNKIAGMYVVCVFKLNK